MRFTHFPVVACGMRIALACASIAGASAGPAYAQYAEDVSASIEVATDERRRGLSWSDGDPVVRGSILIPVAAGLSLEATAVSLWGAERHGGADAVADLGAAYVRQTGGWRLRAQARYHLFPGAAGQGFGELGAGAGYLIGPASVDFHAVYAPRQSSIGGDNLALSVSAAVGVPGIPITVATWIGRSSGDARDTVAAARLRPDGSYWDYGASVDYLKGRWSAGLRYTDSSINAPGSCHTGATLIGRVGLSL